VPLPLVGPLFVGALQEGEALPNMLNMPKSAAVATRYLSSSAVASKDVSLHVPFSVTFVVTEK